MSGGPSCYVAEPMLICFLLVKIEKIWERERVNWHHKLSQIQSSAAVAKQCSKRLFFNWLSEEKKRERERVRIIGNQYFICICFFWVDVQSAATPLIFQFQIMEFLNRVIADFSQIGRKSKNLWDNRYIQNYIIIHVGLSFIWHLCHFCSRSGSRYIASQSRLRTL
jgi:hypothetical protein